MTTKEKKVYKTVTPEFRVSFPSVFQPNQIEGQPADSAKYRVTMLFPKSQDISKLKNIVLQAATDKWGSDKTKWPKGLRFPFRDGSEKDYDGYQDTVFCSASSKNRPGLINREKEDILDPSEFYGGCYAMATVTAFAYDKAGNKGVALGLQNLMKTRDGEAFSGKKSAKEDFDAIEAPPLPGMAAGETESDGAEDILGL